MHRQSTIAANRPLRVGAVNYLNSKPLIYGLASNEQVELVLDLPSRLADALDAERLDVALVPSVEVFRHIGYTVVSDSQPFALGLHWIALGFGAPLTLPGVEGEVVISPAFNFYLLSLWADATGHAAFPVQLPADPVLIGLRIVHQSFEFPTAGIDLIASSPASVVLLP